eukprot:5940984-Pleurochrysis_carterae.AAC.1
MKAGREEGKRTRDSQVNERDLACAVQHGVGADGRAHARTAVTPARGGKWEKGEGEQSHARILCMRVAQHVRGGRGCHTARFCPLRQGAKGGSARAIRKYMSATWHAPCKME